MYTGTCINNAQISQPTNHTTYYITDKEVALQMPSRHSKSLSVKAFKNTNLVLLMVVLHQSVSADIR